MTANEAKNSPLEPEDEFYSEGQLDSELMNCVFPFDGQDFDEDKEAAVETYTLVPTAEVTQETEKHLGNITSKAEEIDHQDVNKILSPTSYRFPIYQHAPRPIMDDAMPDEVADEDVCEVLHPVTKSPFLIEKKAFCQFLKQYGKPVKTYSKDSEKVLKLVDHFCDHSHIEFMTTEKARTIKNSGYTIDVLSTKKGKSGRYKCLFCPLIGSLNKSFPNKENLIRHNALHLRYNKFRCGYCDYKHFRKDTIVQHITLKHHDHAAQMLILKLR